jgi:hypothetical protein
MSTEQLFQMSVLRTDYFSVAGFATHIMQLTEIKQNLRKTELTAC